MKYKLFVSDFDGTLGEFDRIPDATVKAIKEYERRGGKFVICTGRMFDNIRDVCDKYDISDTVVSFQGARINARKSGKTLFADKLADGLAVNILRSLQGLPVMAAVLSDSGLYYTEDSPYIDIYKDSKIVELKKVIDLAAGVEEKQFDALKVNVYCEGINVSDFVREFGKKYAGRCIVNSGGINLAEFVNPAASKGTAVKFLAKYYGINYDEILTIGDSTNDLELVCGAWHGVAVGDGAEELKSSADEITVPYDKQPVRLLLEKYCL